MKRKVRNESMRNVIQMKICSVLALLAVNYRHKSITVLLKAVRNRPSGTVRTVPDGVRTVPDGVRTAPDGF